MDDIFTILIYLIIIVSFFSSFFKKKNVPKPPAETGRQPDSDHNWLPPARQPKTSGGERNILTEIENLFKQDYAVEKPDMSSDDSLIESAPANLKSKTAIEMAKLEHRLTDSEHKMETDWERQRKALQEEKKKIDSKTALQAANFEQMLMEKDHRTSVQFAARRIRGRLMKSESLVELLIIGEVLAKPKSLRR
ncbi:MAG: hypothetical protein K8H86_13550 [Ignavibacteriaceae bacterium]|nr:hypothetical protein [Ignavibacteriaceae bacterium]